MDLPPPYFAYSYDRSDIIYSPRRDLSRKKKMLLALSVSAAVAALVPGSSPRSAVNTRSAATYDRRDITALAAVAFASIAAPVFADDAPAAPVAAPAKGEAAPAAAPAKASKGPPPNLGGPRARVQDRPVGIVSYSKMPQFRDAKGQPIDDWKVAPLGKLDPKVHHAHF